MINTAVSSSALFARKRAAGDGLGNRQHRLQVLGEVPAGIEQSRTFDAHVLNALLQFLELLQCTKQIFLITEDANQILHGFLQVAMDRVRTLTSLVLEGNEHLSRALFDLRGI